MKAVALLLLYLCQGLAFAPSSTTRGRELDVSSKKQVIFSELSSTPPPPFAKSDDSEEGDGLAHVLLPEKKGVVKFVYHSVAGFFTNLAGFVANGMAADDYEVAELPPPYVPAIFGIVLLVGVGVLTSSLGDVMDEEASLGLQSGARAKKEIERSRSSYFGKRR